jgi:hypothetical protein
LDGQVFHDTWQHKEEEEEEEEGIVKVMDVHYGAYNSSHRQDRASIHQPNNKTPKRRIVNTI